jgi:Glyoxalase-like domain
MRTLGLDVVAGGRHEGLGTHNRIVPLGGAYLELLAVADAAQAAASPIGRAVAAADGLMGWAVAVPDADAEAAWLGPSHPMSAASSSAIAGAATSRPPARPPAGSSSRTVRPAARQSIEPAAVSQAWTPRS